MKTITINQQSNIFENFKRILSSFQLLVVGIALPLLFLIGISDGNQKKNVETEMNTNSINHEITAKPVMQLNIARI